MSLARAVLQDKVRLLPAACQKSRHGHGEHVIGERGSRERGKDPFQRAPRCLHLSQLPLPHVMDVCATAASRLALDPQASIGACTPDLSPAFAHDPECEVEDNQVALQGVVLRFSGYGLPAVCPSRGRRATLIGVLWLRKAAHSLDLRQPFVLLVMQGQKSASCGTPHPQGGQVVDACDLLFSLVEVTFCLCAYLSCRVGTAAVFPVT
ncbi:uncharacterized protein B0I36DRAFT_429911 [Microdochium trichocladiopsis]|uniref:Uncharacterized protein n=1 Tax=Microdochium trichocladiopsis TaxID=1682393 RepID=A0A9P8YDG9_9PEZI|nr:uncharacterized protein B0I36DRAFT_429911 [Microdochium trichocladiopsis]KAH7035900.1 hypothetical protein B0I36DRAFT_429911 [Microdochium trichocladiopsis]